ncbi:hypothetical protein NDU88_001554 [Pleurodeles waltl]|uniref:Uncharacterized protein n=1 Tax=Pleurodeles waltl TaxID=8319 RepID=A0AAV7LDI6_PLEWA|nr:hypothetical protein NDU88_001554 [Pleurodeles waltl]
MVLLPKRLNYFANLPMVVLATVFAAWNVLLIGLVWGSRRCRISLKKLQLPMLEGGMSAPNRKASHLTTESHWEQCGEARGGCEWRRSAARTAEIVPAGLVSRDGPGRAQAEPGPRLGRRAQLQPE